MRLQHPNGAVVHVSYSTNVHPAEDLAGIVAQLDRFAVPIRETLGDDVLGLGLWLAAPVAAGLAADRAGRLLLRSELADRGLEVVTINGFPYQAFHAPVVKHAVYRPDWTEHARLRYTLDLAHVLADLLPDEETNGSISTLPLGWRAPWSETQSTIARELLAELALDLSRLHQATGRHIRVGFEPEPGCVIETIDQAVAALSGTDHAYLGLCLDLAHLACAWEEPDDAVAKLAAADIPVVKAQVSAGLEAADPAASRDALATYAEPRFLHQTRTASGRAFDDLPEALDADPPGPWRIHFHVPIHAVPAPPLSATTAILRAGLAALVGGSSPCQHLEVETYTWDVLPPDRRPVDDAGFVAGIAAEVGYARDQLLALGLTPNTPIEVSP